MACLGGTRRPSRNRCRFCRWAWEGSSDSAVRPKIVVVPVSDGLAPITHILRQPPPWLVRVVMTVVVAVHANDNVCVDLYLGGLATRTWQRLRLHDGSIRVVEVVRYPTDRAFGDLVAAGHLTLAFLIRSRYHIQPLKSSKSAEMPTKPELSARAAELQKRHPYFTPRDIQILMDIEAEDAREARKPKPAKR